MSNTPKRRQRKYQVTIQYIEAVATFEVVARSAEEAEALGADCYAETAYGIDDGRVQPGDKIYDTEAPEGRHIGRFVSCDRQPSLGGPVATLVGRAR
jgi:hypothetical protein